MCGIMGFCDKTGARQNQLGATMMGMLTALCRRGPDSAGIAYYSRPTDQWILRIKLGENVNYPRRAADVIARVTSLTAVREQEHDAEYLRLVVDNRLDPTLLQAAIERAGPDVEVISLGHSLEVVKQTGAPDNLDARFRISQVSGTHAIAHTRLSTESRIDLSHSQPFWAHGSLDVASAHNGHITNYHKLRRQYEERGVRFYTENDSEIIGVGLADALRSGATLHEALEESRRIFDGSFSFLAATADEIGFAKDRFGFKPLIVTESDEFVAFATEELALPRILSDTMTTWEPPPGVVRTWRVSEEHVAAAERRQEAEPVAGTARSAHGSH